jgi:uncharacterized protein YqgV (UPF0045/DUF77 family)
MPVRASEADACVVSESLLPTDSPLPRVAEIAAKTKELRISVVGTASSVIPGEGPGSAYPARLEAALQARLPGVKVTVIPHAKPRQSAAEMVRELRSILVDDKPALVVWQTGTYDAVRGLDADEFRIALDEGVETLHAGGADVVLMNMQYSPRTESMIAIGNYVDNLRWVSREREVPLFDRLGIMRHWSESGTFDLYAASKDMATARRVHDCLGRLLATLIVDSAHLGAQPSKASQ